MSKYETMILHNVNTIIKFVNSTLEFSKIKYFELWKYNILIIIELILLE